ncbi:MAG: ATP-binding protein [Rhodothermaceae bacterium]
MTIRNFSREVPSNPDLLPDIEEYVISKISDLGLSEEKLSNLALSVAEAASNSIVHGNMCDESKKIKINIQIDETSITVKFKDEGAGFVPEKVPDPTAPENILKDNGRGIHIMKTFLDSLEYNFDGDGTEVVLKLKI